MLQQRTAIRPAPRLPANPTVRDDSRSVRMRQPMGSMPHTSDVCFTVDYEPDCPPYMIDSFRGVEEGTAPLLAMLHDEGVPATFFSTGVVAERFPARIDAIVAGGHELGCHGHTHRKFPDLTPD